MIKVTTESGTIYIIDEDNKQIKRVPHPGTTEVDSILRGFINVGEFQPYTAFGKENLKIDGMVHVIYPNEQRWSYSTPITEIEYEYEEPSFNTSHKQFTVCDDPECNDEMEKLVESYKKNGENT
jgi:hypothetical protein